MQSQQVSETIYHNASVWTGESPGSHTAFAVTADGRITWLGGHLEEAQAAGLGSETEYVDLQGAFVMPVLILLLNCTTLQVGAAELVRRIGPQGFVDAHVHLVWGGLTLQQMDLSRMCSRSELVAAVEAACGALHVALWNVLYRLPVYDLLICLEVKDA